MLPTRRFAERSKPALKNTSMMVKKRKLRWFGHVSKSSGLAKTILQRTVNGQRRRGRQKKRWEYSIKGWKGMDFASSTRATEVRTSWKGVVVKSSVVPQRPCKVMGKTRLDKPLGILSQGCYIICTLFRNLLYLYQPCPKSQTLVYTDEGCTK